jgi:hypothetical protein
MRTTSAELDWSATARRNGAVTLPMWWRASSPRSSPDETVIGGGNVKKLNALPPHSRAGDNANAFRGGFRLCGGGARSPAHRDSLETTDLIGEVPQMAARSEMPRLRSTSRDAVWRALEDHYGTMRGRHLRDLFAEDAARGERMTAEAAGVFLDYSKNRIDDETLRLLVELAEQSGLRERIDAMFRGEKINVTENRAVLHVALRAPRGASIVVDGKNVVPEVHDVLDKMAEFANRIRGGQWKGHTGKRIRNVINIGIGGSDLGPVMASYGELRSRRISKLQGDKAALAKLAFVGLQQRLLSSIPAFLRTLKAHRKTYSAKAIAAARPITETPYPFAVSVIGGQWGEAVFANCQIELP